MVDAGNDHQRVRGKGHRRGVKGRWRPAHDRQVHLVAGQQAIHRVAVVDQQADTYVGVRLAKLRQQPGREIFGRTDNGDGDASALQPFQRQQCLIGVFQRLQDLARVFEQDFACFGKKDAFADAFEEQRPADLLQLLDLQRDGGVRQMQALGSAGKRKMAGGDREDLQLADCGVSHRLVFVYQIRQ
jgi:hypothetical protein